MFYTNKIVKKDFAIRRTEINKYLKSVIKELNNEVCPREKKKQFLVNFCAYMNVELAIKKTLNFELSMLFECIDKDQMFRKIFNYIDRTRNENIEFMLLAKGGYYGEILQKKYQFIREEVFKKLLEVYTFKTMIEKNRQFGIRESGNLPTKVQESDIVKNTTVKIKEDE